MLCCPQFGEIARADDFLAKYNYLEVRRGFNTFLLRQTVSPQESPLTKYTDPILNMETVTYESAGHELFGWLHRSPAKAAPTLVYIHGGFSTSEPDMAEYAKPFMDAGFNVFVPTFRAENGNDGVFELKLGEVDDAAAAIKFITKFLSLDDQKVYVFGHSTGAAISGLLSLRDDLPVRMTGGADGLYPPDIFMWWQNRTPFDFGDKLEVEMRLMMPHADELKVPHIAYLANDGLSQPFVSAYGMPPYDFAPKLSVYGVNGDHLEAYLPSAFNFIADVYRDLSKQQQGIRK